MIQTHASVFTGIAGFDIAAEWMLWENIFNCEINPFNRRLLKYYAPKAEQFSDITKTDFRKYEGLIDILTGGFPCQPYSVAGQRKGTGDERHLWPEMLRAISEIKPRWVVGENVRGLVNWDGGLVFDQVQADLEMEGYEVLPFLLPACGVNAPHRRERIWFVAYADNKGRRSEPGKVQQANGKIPEWYNDAKLSDAGNINVASNTSLVGVQERRATWQQEPSTHAQEGLLVRSHPRTDWQEFPTQPPLCSGDDGLPAQLDGLTFSAWRNKSIQGYGNAIVPQVALQIFKAIEAYDLMY